jgi:hypothetical protein
MAVGTAVALCACAVFLFVCSASFVGARTAWALVGWRARMMSCRTRRALAAASGGVRAAAGKVEEGARTVIKATRESVQYTSASVAQAAQAVARQALGENAWVAHVAGEGSSLGCPRDAWAPSERPLLAAVADQTCSAVCSTRYRGSDGRYAGRFDATNNRCLCRIRDCASAGAPACEVRTAVMTPTDGIAVGSADLAASMCPSLCAMKHPGRRADATGRASADRAGFCECVVDGCAPPPSGGVTMRAA